MLAHWYTLLLLGESEAAPPGPGGDGSSAIGGSAIKAKLLRAFKDDEERKAARANLAAVPKQERTALRAVAETIAHAPAVTVESVDARITAALADLGKQATADHLEWALYFLRVEADAARVAQAAVLRAMRREDDEEAAMLLLLT